MRLQVARFRLVTLLRSWLSLHRSSAGRKAFSQASSEVLEKIPTTPFSRGGKRLDSKKQKGSQKLRKQLRRDTFTGGSLLRRPDTTRQFLAENKT
jgi:hypothetical protein